MLSLKSAKNKLILTTVIEILFTIILILLLVFVRQKSIDYLYQVQDLSYEIENLEQDLITQNLTTYDREQAQQTVDKVDSILTKGLFLLRVLLPLSLIILSLIFYFFIWKILTNMSIKRFLLSSIIPLILLLLFVYFTLNYIAYKFNYVSDSPLVIWIILTVLLLITYYIALFFLSNNKTLKQNIGLSKKYIGKLAVHFIFNLITNLIYLILVFIIFFLTYVETSIILPSIILLVIIIIINLQRNYLINKISKLN